MDNIQIIEKYNQAGPRYTSYPPAPFFNAEIDSLNFRKMIEKSNHQSPEGVSVYVHIPFCKQLCYFCGCNTQCINRNTDIQAYIQTVIKEIKEVSPHIDSKRKLTQIHFGGGTPNAIEFSFIEKIMNVLYSVFSFSDHAEVAMECNPAYLKPSDIDAYTQMGFNRLSLGVQDFNEDVLKAVNRKPSLHPIDFLFNRMRDNKMKGINLDLIYGLPAQSVDSFAETVKKAVHALPDRIVTFSYAHVPWVKPAQKRLEDKGLPNPTDKLAMFQVAFDILTKEGYVPIGMDHYARPEDELSIALKNKTLHRNFQGYCTQETTGQVYAFGATAISQLYGGYYQNEKDTHKYIEMVSKSGLATARGYELSWENTIVREVINNIMCNGKVDFNDIAQKYQVKTISIKEIVGYAKENFDAFIEDGLLKIEKDTLQVVNNGFLVVRNIAMLLDPLLKKQKAQYSKTI